MTPFSTKKRRARALLAAVALVIALPASTVGKQASGFQTPVAPYITLTGPGKTVSLLTVGENAGVGGFTFEGLPDGIGIMPSGKNQIDVFVNHEQSTVPFQDGADYVDSSVSRLTINTKSMTIVDASVPLPPEAGFIRFCSSFLAGPAEGFSDYTLFLNEESSDPLTRPLGQAGYTVVLNAETEAYAAVPGLGRMNHENAVVVPGGWDDFAIVTGDDTFSAPSSQLYLYTAADEVAIWEDTGDLWAFQITATEGGPLADPADPFNGANDYGDMVAGDSWSGHFIPVPGAVARGDQTALETWSNDNNVFQFIRVEDIAYDPAHPRTIYFADTGEARALTDADWVALGDGRTASGRLHRGPGGSNGGFGNGRIFKMTFNAADPTVVDEFSIMLDADTVMLPSPNGDLVKMRHPDNVAIGMKSLMVQEDTSNALIWRYSLHTGKWSVVATVNDPAGESSGIVDASAWFGPGWWMLDVQAHGTLESETFIDPTTFKREDGQLLMMFIPSS